MSANLLAEFESFYQPGGVQAPAATAPQAPSSPGVNEAEIDDDDFGDFETADAAKPAAPPTVTVRPKEALPARPKQEVIAARPPAKPRDENVLFDAEDEFEADDDFGDFEGGSAAAVPALETQPLQPSTAQHQHKQGSLLDFDDFTSFDGPSSAPQKAVSSRVSSSSNQPKPRPAEPQERNLATSAFDDLLGLDETAQPKPTPKPAPRPQAKKPAQAKPKQSFQPPSKPAAAPTAAAARAVQPPTPPTALQEEDDWDDFETAEPQEAASSGTPEPLHLDTVLLPRVPSGNESPPTNIPPPAILLSLFPSLASKAQAQLFDPISRLGDDRDMVLQLPTTRQYLSGLIDASVVLARIIAGRKNRWKRDTILSQSMRIGPASSSGKSGGMKLAGVDKAENAREERDVADAVAAWRGQLGRLKSAVNSAGKLGDIPEILETYTVRLAPASEGAIGSPKACVLCGLKRNERIARVDTAVEDSFGEWWTEHWGHNDCARLWYAQKDDLRSR